MYKEEDGRIHCTACVDGEVIERPRQPIGKGTGTRVKHRMIALVQITIEQPNWFTYDDTVASVQNAIGSPTISSDESVIEWKKEEITIEF